MKILSVGDKLTNFYTDYCVKNISDVAVGTEKIIKDFIYE
jgi:hypothetical protein